MNRHSLPHVSSGLIALICAVFLTTVDANNTTTVKPLDLGCVLFSNNSTNVDQTAWPLLRSAALLMREHHGAKIELEGHADVRGSRNDNITLSLQRASAIAEILIRNGVARERISVVARGEQRASANINDRLSQQFDRRVNIRVALQKSTA